MNKIKPRKLIIVILVVIIVLTPILWFYFNFYGTPWGKLKAKQEITTYLSHKFEEKQTIIKVAFDPVNGYFADCYDPNKKIDYMVSYHDGLVNDYYLNLWQEQIDTALNDKNNNLRTKSIIEWDELSYNKYGLNVKKIPNFFTVQNELDTDNYDSRPSIYIDLPYNFTDWNTEKQKVFDLLLRIREKTDFQDVCLSYKNKDKDCTIGFYVIRYDDVKKMNTPQDVADYFIKKAAKQKRKSN